MKGDNYYRQLYNSMKRMQPFMDDYAKRMNSTTMDYLQQEAIKEQIRIEIEQYKTQLTQDILNNVSVKVTDEVTPKIEEIIENINNMGKK